MPSRAAPTEAPMRLILALAHDLAEVRPIALQARQFIADHGWSEVEVNACELALVEACNNAIHHGGAATAAEPIEIEILCDDANVELRVFDHTAGFAWPDRVQLPEEASESGRGLFLITSLMEKATYYRSPGRNCLVMTRSRGASGKPALRLPDLGRVTQEAENELMIRDMVEELSSCYESMAAIFRYSSELVKNCRVADFSHQLLGDLLQITSADWFLLRLRNASRLVATACSGQEDPLAPLDWSEPAGAEPSAEVAAVLNRQDVSFDAQKPLPPGDPLLALARRSQGFVHPFFFGDELIGTLTIGKALSSPPFTAAQENVVHTFADFLAIQIVNARFQEELINNRLVSRELEIAKNIQRSLLPMELPQLSGFGIAGACESARQVGGDFYDAVRLSEHSLLLVIADVMGKGIPAAIFAAILRSLLRAMPELNHQPAALLSRVNHLLFAELSGVDMFITAALLHLDARDRRLVAASAGHCPVLVASEAQSQVQSLTPEGMPLGILPDTLFRDEVVELKPNSRILMFTDGLPDACNAHGESFGQHRLMNWLVRSVRTDRPAIRLKDELMAELATFQAGVSLTDDQTFLVIAERSPPASSHNHAIQ
jgi:serine phosphatase RsbU (regulator of sigma subunit)/anti-sigma regulatory factor (Ser/Thr protein kinase)